MVSDTCEDMLLGNSRRATGSFDFFHINTVERNDWRHRMRAQRIHHSNDDGDCDSNSANDADVDHDNDDSGKQQRLKPFVFSG